LTNWKNIILFVIAATTAISGGVYFAWDVLARPDIRRQIRCTTDPIADALEFQTDLMMENLSDEQIKRAQDRYLARKRAMVGRQP
jgi:hypothetical protein